MKVVHGQGVTFGLRLTDSTGSDETWVADTVGLEVHYGTRLANGYCEVLLARAEAERLSEALSSLSKALPRSSPVSGDSGPIRREAGAGAVAPSETRLVTPLDVTRRTDTNHPPKSMSQAVPTPRKGSAS